jgi:hypothetical protein
MDEAEGIFAEDMTRISRMLAAIIEADESPGDCQFNARIEVISAPDEFGGVLVGWIEPYDDTWRFTPCVPQLYLSLERKEWVTLEEIRRETEAARARGSAAAA